MILMGEKIHWLKKIINKFDKNLMENPTIQIRLVKKRNEIENIKNIGYNRIRKISFSNIIISLAGNKCDLYAQ